jgi:hypothetical protein
MNKLILIPITLTLALGGCASTGPNQAIGTGVGAVGGYAVGRALGGGAVGSAVGAVVGSTVGSEVGRNMDQPAPRYVAPRERVIVEERPVYIERPRHREECDYVRQWDNRIGGYRDIRVCH